MDESHNWATVDPRRAKSVGRRGNMVIQGEREGASTKGGKAGIQESEDWAEQKWGICWKQLGWTSANFHAQ